MAAISNNEIKFIKSLSLKKNRDKEGLFVVEGEKLVAEAVKSGWKIKKIYRRDEIGEEAMSRISATSSPAPSIAIVHQAPGIRHPNTDVLPRLLVGGGLFLGLDAVRDPGNLGTILRIADWFGVKAVFASPDTVEVFNPKTVQATMGAIFRVNIIYTDLAAVSREVRSCGGSVYGTFLDGEILYGKTLNTGDRLPSVIIVGNEANGISDTIEAEVTDRLYIPPYPADDPGSESLNVAVATAITIAEFRRRLQ